MTEKDSWIPLTGLTDFHFDNTYNADGDLAIRLTKTINSVAPDSKPFKRQTFRYTLTYLSADGSVSMTAENDGSGWAEFDLGRFMGDTEAEQMFTIDDVGSNQFFRYTLREDVLDEAGITVDTVEYGITIQITDQGAGRLGAKADIVATCSGTRVIMPTVTINRLPRRGDSAYDTDLQTMLGTLSRSLTFNNRYEADGQWQTGVRKLINGVLIDTAHYRNHTFTFVMTDSQGKTVGTVQNGADGTALFPVIRYTQDDIGSTYTYVISETGTAGDGVSLDAASWEIDVRIDDLGEGVLQPVVTQMRKGGETVWSVEDETAPPGTCDFDNPYDATGSIQVNATKKMTGRDLFAGEFTFRILDESVPDENGQPTVVATGTNDADGNVVFSEINYTLKDVGTHRYTVVEVLGDTAGVVYDELSWTVVSTVSDNGDGTLHATYVTMSRGD